MKLSITVAWLLLLALHISSTSADISLALRNKQYLPPPIRELPINEEHFKAQQQNKFKENSYGNSKYPTFEVHNHYEAARSEGGIKQKSLEKEAYFANNNYESAEKIPFEHPNADFDFDTSYLDFATENEDSFEAKKPYASKFRAAEYLPPNTQGQQYYIQPVQNPLPAQSYQATQHQAHSNAFEKPLSIQVYNSNQIVNNDKNVFKGPDYLPPRQSQIEAPFKGLDYLPPVQNQLQQLQPQQQQVQALPEGYDFKKPPNAEQAIEELHKLPENESANLNYGPAKQVVSNYHNGNLPPSYDVQNTDKTEQAIKLLHSQETSTKSSTQSIQAIQKSVPAYHRQRSSKVHNNENQFQNLDSSHQQFRPETVTANAAQALNIIYGQQRSYENNQLQVTQNGQSRPVPALQQIPAKAYKATDQAINTGSQPDSKQFVPSSLQSFKGPDYLPPAEGSQNFKGSEYLPPTVGSQSFRGPEYLPPSSEYRTSKGELGETSTTATFKGPDYLPPTPGAKPITTPREAVPSVFQGHGYLPPSSEYQTPNGKLGFTSATPAFKGPDYLPPAAGLAPTGLAREVVPEVFKGPEYLPPSSAHLTTKGDFDFTSTTAAFKGSNYLPPTPGSTPTGSPREAVSKVFKGSDYLPPVNKQPVLKNQFKAPDYLPPTEHRTLNMYPLSSYMTNIKPNDRYGSRRPFPEYGLPPAKTIAFSNGNEIAPMYRQPTTKPQYYAPAMSYTNNAFSTQFSTQLQATPALSQEARQALQTFMPEEIRQTLPANYFQATVPASKASTTLQAPKTAKSKIRTVQIVNPNAIKTLKVLESLDGAGVKTIKILGPSSEVPIGNHRNKQTNCIVAPKCLNNLCMNVFVLIIKRKYR